MRKDLREARWLVAAYVGIVALSTAHALRLPATSNDLLDVSMFFFVGVGLFVVATLVQADSPTRSDAFWASRPFHPSAVLGAKLVLAILIVLGPPLLGQSAALSRLALESGALAWLLGQSMYVYAMWLLVSMVVAALKRDLRTFVVTIIGIPLLDMALAAAFSWFPSTSSVMRITVAILTAVGAVVLLAVLYRTRDIRRRTSVAGFVVVTGAFCALFADVSNTASTAKPAAPFRDIGLRVEVPDSLKMAESTQLHLVVRFDNAPGNERLTFMPESALFHLRNGKTLQTWIERRSVTLFTPVLPIAGNITWLDRRDSSSGGRGGIVVALSDDDRLAIRGGAASVVVQGTVIATTPRIIGTFGLGHGQSAARDGARADLIMVGHGLSDTMIEVRVTSATSSLRPTPASAGFDAGTLDFALVNATRAEARMLYRREVMARGGSLVLPGIDYHDETSQFHTEGPGGATVRVDDDWMFRAKVVVADWIAHDRYSVRGETSIP